MDIIFYHPMVCQSYCLDCTTLPRALWRHLYIFVSHTQCLFFQTLYLVDAHPVNADAGGKFTELILSTERTNVDGLLHWIVRRLVLSNSKTYYQSISIIDLVEKNFWGWVKTTGVFLSRMYLDQTIFTNFSSFCDICKKNFR